uniref:Uncharacterized protein n=1 Tax=Strombidium rassoulzadegani TaxID=1082188 RepID=A0A7S3FYT3_9SPIT|mmetsp:Transcript_33/g.62  ORF Transcript_33/g.62 Transcript_33/m.62 type:complete len:113 (+) Transcript_33:914-1252(+)
MKSQVDQEVKKMEGSKGEWDRSTVASERQKQSVEEKVATRIANDILKDNQKLRGVHSNQSIKKILINEAKRQLLKEYGDSYNPPVMAKIVERGEVNRADPSNLPYLHKCPAV